MRGFAATNHVWRHRVLAAGFDVLVVLLAYFLMLQFRFAGSVPAEVALGSRVLTLFLAVAVIVHLTLNSIFHVYTIVHRYVGLRQALWVVQAMGLSVLLLLVFDLAWFAGRARVIPLSVVIMGGAAAGVTMVAFRFYSRAFQTLSLSPVRDGKRILLVGAGSAAEMLVRQIHQNRSLGVEIIGLVDDKPGLRGMRIHQYPVLGSIAEAAGLVDTNGIEEFVIAIPSADSAKMERIYSLLRPAQIPIKTLPPVGDIINGQVSMADVRDLKYEDLLGRSPVETDLAAVAGYLRGRRVLVTGAAGSIGSELCRQIAKFGPENLILVDRNESGLYDVHEEFRARGFTRYTLIATHIQQRAKIRLIFHQYRPHVVFHAAAFKHVPLMEAFPDEAVLNNVRGTRIVALEAAASGVERFINISTDKAADPISAMGASKAVAELVVRDMGRDFPATRFCSVRFGNVLGSRGSVIPIFQRQIEVGGPVTVTHQEMTRYFMSISEAVQLVLHAGSMVNECERRSGVFILNMGDPVKILDLAHKMIQFAKNGNSASVEVVFTGLRPGERMHELLVGSTEQTAPTSHPMIALVHPITVNGVSAEQSGERFREQLEALIALGQSHAQRASIIDALRALLPTYQPFALDQPGPFVASAPAKAGESSLGIRDTTGVRDTAFGQAG